MVSVDPQIWIAAFFTIAATSYAFRDNIVFKFAENTFIGIAAGHAIVMGVKNIRDYGWTHIMSGELIYVVVFMLGVMLYAMGLHPLINPALLAKRRKGELLADNSFFIEEFVKVATGKNFPVHGGRIVWVNGLSVQMDGGGAVAGQGIVKFRFGCQVVHLVNVVQQ